MINSDGSHLTPVTEFGLPADLSRPTFSADGTRLAFLGNFSPEDKWHLFLANADGSEATDLGAGDFGDFGDIQFISEADCLHVTQFISWVPEGGINLAIEKWCAGQLQPEELETVTFPVFYQIHFSPQGDALLAYGQDSTHKAHLVVHEIGDSTQEIFSSSSEYVTGAARWLPDGEQIEFVGTGYLDPNNTITTTFNLIELDGDNLQLRLSLAATFGITEGNWPPDGEEFIFTYGHGSITPAESGLYVLDLNTGEWRQILSYFYLGSPSNIDVWQQDAGRASLLWTGLPATTHLTGLWPVSHRAVPVSQV
jgi:Tol biopolymer transport system component